MLRIEERLQEKLRVARRTIGVAGRILPAHARDHDAASPRGLAEQSSAVDVALRSWSRPSVESASTGGALAVVASTTDGFVAAIRESGTTRLIADVGGGMSSDPCVLSEAVGLASGKQASTAADAITPVLDRINACLLTSRANVAIDFAAAASARARRAALTRVAQTLARTPRHRRSLMATLAHAARAVATAPLGEGAERVLETLVDADLPDEAWLRSMATFGALNARPVRPVAGSSAELVGLIVLVRQ
jgi:hypothetical protein